MSKVASPLFSVFTPVEAYKTYACFYSNVLAEHVFSLSPAGGDQVPLVLFESSIACCAMSGRNIFPLGLVELSFDLIFEVLFAEDSSLPIGLRLFFDESHSIRLYADSKAVLRWADLLKGKLIQRGFHRMFKGVRKLGMGNFASVFEVERLTDGRHFAAKGFIKEKLFTTESGKESLVNEIGVMRELSRVAHEHVLGLEGVYDSENTIYMILELVEGGHLKQLLRSHPGPVPCAQVACFMKGLLEGLRYLHQHRIMHRDLKPENILLRGGPGLSPVLADFGLASKVDLDRYLFSRCGTPGYVAPEVFSVEEAGHLEPECDIFSAGAILHLLLFNKPLFTGDSYADIYRNNRTLKFSTEPEEWTRLPEEAFDLLRQMLHESPKERISAEAALQHDFFRQLRPEAVESCATAAGSPYAPPHHDRLLPALAHCRPMEEA